MKKAPEVNRIKSGATATDESCGNNGTFVIPHYKIKDYYFICIISDGLTWDHVSVSIYSKRIKVKRCPTWEEMCFIKEQFFKDDEPVMQLHPAQGKNVRMHPYCLHLWRPQSELIPLPDPLMVGFPGSDVQA